MANTLELFCNGAVGFIEWLGLSLFPITTKKKLRNTTKGQGTNDCSEADPLPSRRPKRNEPEAITEGSNRAEDEKWPREEAVNPATSRSVE